MIIKYFLCGFQNKPTSCVARRGIRRLHVKAVSVYPKRAIAFRRMSSSNCKSQKLLDAFRTCLYKSFDKQDHEFGNKVSVIGSGAVGMGCAISLLAKGVTNHLALYDINEKLCHAESLDLQHGSLFLNNCNLEPTCNVKATKDSRVVILTCGARVKENETRLQVAQKTADIIKSVMPDLVQQSPKAVYIVVSNPADVMTWVAHKVGKIPYERCISTGCHLDTARFRLFIGKLLGVSTSSVHGYVLGEHGESSVPMWSAVTVGGVRLQKLIPTMGTGKDPMEWSKVHKDVIDAAFKVIAGKGYTNWAIGLTVADVVSAIFENSNRVLSLSTNANGMCGIKENIFLSLPCIVNKWGLFGIVRPQLSEWETNALKKSAKELLEAQNGIKL